MVDVETKERCQLKCTKLHVRFSGSMKLHQLMVVDRDFVYNV